MDNERDERDNYETPDEAVDHLLSNVTLTGVMWDPSCGRGKIVKALIHAGQRAHGSDKFVYVPIDGMRTQVKYGYDFIGCLGTTDSIIMNPPFDQSDDHVRHALKIIPSDGKVCVLLRLTWIAAQKRADLLKHLHKIIICGRLKMLPPGVPDQGHSGAVDFAWFVFGHRVVNATQIVRVR
jgi:hypothetical protein